MRSRQIRKLSSGGDALTMDNRAERRSPRGRRAAGGMRRTLSNGRWTRPVSDAEAQFVR